MQTLLNPASSDALLVILRLIWRGRFNMAPHPEDRSIDPATFPGLDDTQRRALIIRAMSAWPHAEWSKGIGWAISQANAAASGGTKRGPGRPKYKVPAPTAPITPLPASSAPVNLPSPVRGYAVAPDPTFNPSPDTTHLAPAPAPIAIPAQPVVIPDPPPVVIVEDAAPVVAPAPAYVPQPGAIDLRAALALNGYMAPPEMTPLLMVLEHALNAGAPVPNILLSGESGTGKTAFALALARVMGAPLHAVPLALGTTTTQLIGQLILEADGGSAWRDGFLPRAYRLGGVLLLDELGAAQDGVCAVMHPALESPRRPFLIAQTGESVQPAPLVIIGTDNGAGVGAASQRNRHTTGLSAALRERFTLQLTVEGPKGPDMISALVNHHGVSLDLAQLAEKIMSAGHSLVQSGAVYSTAFGFRLAVAFAKTCAMLTPRLDLHSAALAAADLTLALSITEPERMILGEALRRVLPAPSEVPNA
jgi:MoxR-like ATPase